MVLYRVWIVAPKTLVKSIKTTLEAHSKYDKSLKIVPFTGSILCDFQTTTTDFDSTKVDHYLLPTIESVDFLDDDITSALLLENKTLLEKLGVGTTTSNISLAVRQPNENVGQREGTPLIRQKGELLRTLEEWLWCLPPEIRTALPIPIHSLVISVTPHYTLYPPLLQLPENTFQTEPWPSLVKGFLAPHLPELYRMLCRDFHITHIAIHGPVHVLVAWGPSTPPSLNILRSPTSLRRLHGSLGPPDLPPSASNFPAVLWVSHTQHGVIQVWAPLYTMFSRGNIREKARILTLPELDSKTLGRDVGETSAVDLYSGIGYFAFFYVKRGVGKVICWELNGWSVEGLRRGAKANGWQVKTIEENEELDVGLRNEKLIVFQEDNRNAIKRIKEMRSQIPSVRHVNCGLIPTSVDSWEIAVKILDPMEGGWIHVHENILDSDLETKIGVVVMKFKTLLDDLEQHRIVECLRANRVKSYGPHITHYVLEIYVGPCTKV
ncbi:hypothetical protein MMC14_008809 [Varicellaria rhodocarpa]|nr:hypothetical protein [Varicellaria rhodocarpa]